jgi:osmotically-inducible protein OsmY
VADDELWDQPLTVNVNEGTVVVRGQVSAAGARASVDRIVSQIEGIASYQIFVDTSA